MVYCGPFLTSRPAKILVAPFSSLNFGLDESLNMLRETVVRFAETEVAPLAAEIDRTNEFPLPLWRRMGDLGLLGITVSEEYGGSGMGSRHRDGRTLTRVSLGGAELWRALKSLREPDFS